MKQPAVLSTRVQLNRNYADLPFDLQTNYNLSGISIARTLHALETAGLASEMDLHRINTLSGMEQQSLMQQQLISPDLLRFPQNSAVILQENEGISIMLNERDHLVIQVKVLTDDVRQAAEKCLALEEVLARNSALAYDPAFGHLTARVEESGIAMQGMMTLHLPMVSRSRRTADIRQQVTPLGVDIFPLMGEDKEDQGALYQMQTKTGAFAAPADLYQAMYQAAAAVLETEQACSQEVMKREGWLLENAVRRAYGILRHGSLLPMDDFLFQWGDLRTGAVHYHFRQWPALSVVDELLRLCLPARLASLDLSAWLALRGLAYEVDESLADDVDYRRALVCRAMLGGLSDL